MKIAAGVLLIIAAIINVVAGFRYAVEGAGGERASRWVAAVAALDSATAPDDKSKKEEMEKAMGYLSDRLNRKYLGFFLLAMFVLQLVGGIKCFVKKGAMFILIVGVLSLVAEIADIYVINFGIWNITGLTAGVLAISAAMAIKKGAGGAAFSVR